MSLRDLVPDDDGDLDGEQLHRDGDLRRRKASVVPQRQKGTSAIAEQLSDRQKWKMPRGSERRLAYATACRRRAP